MDICVQPDLIRKIPESKSPRVRMRVKVALLKHLIFIPPIVAFCCVLNNKKKPEETILYYLEIFTQIGLDQAISFVGYDQAPRLNSSTCDTLT